MKESCTEESTCRITCRTRALQSSCTFAKTCQKMSVVERNAMVKEVEEEKVHLKTKAWGRAHEKNGHFRRAWSTWIMASSFGWLAWACGPLRGHYVRRLARP